MNKQTRREFLKRSGAGVAGISLLPLSWPRLARAEERSKPQKFVLNAPLTHSDWMLKPNQKWGLEGVRHMLDRCKECGWNKVHWRVLDAGRSTYKSKLLRPGSTPEESSFWNPQTDAEKALTKRFFPNATEAYWKDLTAKMAKLDYSTFDSFAAAIEYGHQIGLKIHAWVTINEDDHGWGWPSEFTKKHPEFRWQHRDGRPYQSQLSFAFPEVRKYKLGILKELFKYDLDGLFLDWIRTGDVRDNPQNDPDGVADYGYEKPLVEKYRKKFGKHPKDIPNGHDAWVQMRAEPQTEFMREVRKLVRKQKRKIPIAAMVGHPWHYRGTLDKIDGNLRGLLLDVNTWAREGLMDAIVPAGYYRDGGNAELAYAALQKETEGKVDVWTYAWVPSNNAEAESTFAIAEKLRAKQILFWEADYIDDRANAAELKNTMKARAEIN